jgi:hypothetical protein
MSDRKQAETEADPDAAVVKFLRDQEHRPQGEMVGAAPELAAPVWSTGNAMTISLVVLVFGVIVMALTSYLSVRRIDKDTILKIVVIPMIVMSGVFLIVAGYSESQISPMVGLLGTIVGYVLGTNSTRPQDDGKSKDPIEARRTVPGATPPPTATS